LIKDCVCVEAWRLVKEWTCVEDFRFPFARKRLHLRLQFIGIFEGWWERCR
jgi:hypothetical protein